MARREPEGKGLEGEVCSMARAPCLTARKTLRIRVSESQLWVGLGRVGSYRVVSCRGGSQGGGWVRLSRLTHLKAFVRITVMKSSAELSNTRLVVKLTPAFAKNTSSRPYNSKHSSTTPLTSSSLPASMRRHCTSTPGYREAISRLWVSRCEVL